MKITERVSEQDSPSARKMLKSFKDNQKAVVLLLESARREVLFSSYDLQPRMTNNKAASEALLNLLRKNRRAQIKILLDDNRSIKRDGHRWLEIARRFTSNIQIRTPRAEDLGAIDSYLLVDDKALLYKPHADHYEGYLSFKASEQVKHHKKTFVDIWNYALPDPEVSRLHL